MQPKGSVSVTEIEETIERMKSKKATQHYGSVSSSIRLLRRVEHDVTGKKAPTIK